MQSKISALLATLLAAAAPFAGAANVAGGGTVSIAGDGFFQYSAEWGSGVGAPLSSVVDGITVPDGQQWNVGTVYWQGDAVNTLTIQLASAATVSSLFLQADNNDFYAVSYEDLGGTWHAIGATLSPHGAVDPSVGSVDWGMGTASYTFADAVTAQAFQITATGDSFYAVSEFQADGAFLPAVPEPGTGLLMLAGLGALAAAARRRPAR